MQCHIDIITSKEFHCHIEVINTPPMHCVINNYLIEDYHSYLISDHYQQFKIYESEFNYNDYTSDIEEISRYWTVYLIYLIYLFNLSN